MKRYLHLSVFFIKFLRGFVPFPFIPSFYLSFSFILSSLLSLSLSLILFHSFFSSLSLSFSLTLYLLSIYISLFYSFTLSLFLSNSKNASYTPPPLKNFGRLSKIEIVLIDVNTIFWPLVLSVSIFIIYFYFSPPLLPFSTPLPLFLKITSGGSSLIKVIRIFFFRLLFQPNLLIVEFVVANHCH